MPAALERGRPLGALVHDSPPVSARSAAGAVGGRRSAECLRSEASSAISSGVLKRLLHRRHARRSSRSAFVGLRRRPTSSSMPSGHTASAVAFATAAAIELPMLAVPLGALAATVAYSRVYNGVHYPATSCSEPRSARSVAAATKVWPRGRRVAGVGAAGTAHGRGVAGEPSADGAGLTIVVNPAARSGHGVDPTEDSAPRCRGADRRAWTTRPTSSPGAS